ncbi:complement component 1, r subcomponent [Polymixia lowei]
MGWTHCVVWFLCGLVCECWRLPRSEPPMHGEVQSPQYPQPYAPNLLKQWDLSVPQGYQIKLTFTHMDIEASAGCYYDAVTILSNQKILGKFCGQENSADGHHPGNQPILSPGNRLTLVFQSDDSNPEQHQQIGFSAHYQAIDIDECSEEDPGDGSGPRCSQICHNTLGSYLCSCHHGYELRPDQRTCVLSCGGGIFDEPEGQLSSPAYPDPSPHGLSCQHVISVEPGFTVTLNFSSNFHIESVDTQQGLICLYHWLQVTIPEKEPIKLCGGKSPGVMATDSNTVRLDYHTDWAGLSQGWSLDYSTHRVSCPFPSGVGNGRVTPVFTDYFYRDYIHVRCEQGYKLMMDGHEIKSYSSMCQSNGQWHLSLPECQIIDCGEPKPLLNGGVTFLSGFKNQHRSVIQYHCNEPFYSLLDGVNVSYTCAADRNWRDNHDTPIIPSCIPVCGKPTELIRGYKRIIGGSAAPLNTIPWQVLLSVSGKRGGGIVIGDRWVMTAAHNLVFHGIPVKKDVIRVYMGNNDVNELLKFPVAEVASLHVHHGYRNPNDIDFDNDIALIKLQHPLTFYSSTMPICLPAEGATYINGLLGLVSGFGVSIVNGAEMLSNQLKYIRIPLVDQETCSNSLLEAKKESRHAIPVLSDNMFCAGIPEAGNDSCHGDSGGAFALRANGQFWAAGIVSWGVDCGQPGRYGVYTRVASYIDWIKKIMLEN